MGPRDDGMHHFGMYTPHCGLVCMALGLLDSLHLAFAAGGAYSQGLLLQKAFRLGIGTNTTAEAHGLAAAIKTSVQYLLWGD